MVVLKGVAAHRASEPEVSFPFRGTERGRNGERYETALPENTTVVTEVTQVIDFSTTYRFGAIGDSIQRRRRLAFRTRWVWA